MIADGDKCDGSCQDVTQDEGHEVEVDMLGEVLQPSLHRIIRGWTGGQAREEYKNDVLHGKQSDDMRDASAQHLANADFFGTALHGQHRQPEDAEAGDVDRKSEAYVAIRLNRCSVR